MKRIVFLYTEIADYLLKALEHYVSAYDARVMLVRWPVNKEAPFDIPEMEGIDMVEKEKYSREALSQMVGRFKPDLILSAGWRDKDYLHIIKPYFGQIPTVLCFDNQWQGNLRQRLAAAISPLYLKRIFSQVWIPGTPQERFAHKLGFAAKAISTGFYCCDMAHFHQLYLRALPAKTKAYPRRFLYCARYVKWKGIFELWKAFIELQQEKENDWELWCLGTGEEYEHRVEHPKIRHFGFVQPSALEPFLQSTGVYILPSHFEPWAVSVHEYAASGFPMLLSNKVGSAGTFLKNGWNGFVMNTDTQSIKTAMRKMMDLTDAELLEMGNRSVSLSRQITPASWAATLNGFLATPATPKKTTEPLPY